MATAITMKRYDGSDWVELAPATTIAQVSGLAAALAGDATPTINSTNLVQSGGVYTSINNVAAIANGKTASYVCSYASNADLNSSNAQVTITSALTDTSGNSIAIDDLKVGDVILVTEVDVPDRWVGSIVSGTSATLYKMETTKVDLTNYVTLDGTQTISGVKKFSNGIKFNGSQGYTSTIIGNTSGTQTSDSTIYAPLTSGTLALEPDYADIAVSGTSMTGTLSSSGLAKLNYSDNDTIRLGYGSEGLTPKPLSKGQDDGTYMYYEGMGKTYLSEVKVTKATGYWDYKVYKKNGTFIGSSFSDNAVDGDIWFVTS